MIQRIHMEIIEALQETGTLTGAAEKLNLTQSALTHSIKKLEHLTGSTIWKKEGRKLILTESGELLLSSTKRLLPQLRKIDLQLEELGSGKTGTLTIGVECHPCFQWLVKIVGDYLDQWPKVDLNVTREFQFDGLHALQNHKVNMLITPDFLPGEGIIHYEVQDFTMQLMVSKDHWLASKSHLEINDLNHETLFTYPVDKSRLDVFTLGFHPAEHIPIETTEIMVQLVASKRGVSAFPDWLISKYAGDFPVIGIPLSQEGLSKKLYLVIREEDESLQYIKGFIKLGQDSRIN